MLDGEIADFRLMRGALHTQHVPVVVDYMTSWRELRRGHSFTLLRSAAVLQDVNRMVTQVVLELDLLLVVYPAGSTRICLADTRASITASGK